MPFIRRKVVDNALLENDSTKKKVNSFMTLKQLATNPGGPNSAYFANRAMVIKALNINFANVTRRNPNFNTKIYVNDDKTTVLYHLKVPSESEKRAKVTYDVIFEIDISNTRNIMKAPVKMFSNSPAFIFTYANVMYNMDLIPKWLHVKMNKESRENKPIVKNEYEVLGFEKSIYYAIKYLSAHKLGLLQNHTGITSKLSHGIILSNVDSYEKKINETRHVKKEKDKKKKKNKKMITKTKRK